MFWAVPDIGAIQLQFDECDTVDIRSDVSKPCSQHTSGAFGGEAVRFPSVGRPHGAQAGHDGFQWLQPPGGDVLAAEREHIEQRQCFLGFFQRCNVLEQGSGLALLGNCRIPDDHMVAC